MEQNFNTINLEYVETKKVSLVIKAVALILVVIFTFVPMYEFLTQFMPNELYQCGCFGCYRMFYGYFII